MRATFIRSGFRMFALLFLSSLAVFGETQTPAPTTGIEGVVSIGPIHGGPTLAGEADSKPLAKVTFEVSSSTGAIASFQTDETGHFRVALAPGHYSIKLRDFKTKPHGCGPFEVEVPAEGFKRIQWDCDSGLR